MTSPTGCDGCQDELDLFAVSNRDTGHAQFLGPLCLAMFGATMLLGTSIEVADAAFKGLGYQPTAATKKARKDAEDPEYDPNRVIAEVVADKPEPPDERPQDECPICGAMVFDDEQIDHMHTEHPDITTLAEIDEAIAARAEPAENTEPAPPY